MPRWLRIALVVLLVVFLSLFTGLPVMMGGGAMACETCPASSVMVGATCVAVLVAALVLFFALSSGWMLRTRRDERLVSSFSAGLDRPPQLI